MSENIFDKLGSLMKTPEGGGLLSDDTAGTLFPYLGMAGGKAPSNRDLINASILRGSLELLKPRQPGENLASQASRALQAGQEPLKTMAAIRLQQTKARQSGQLGQASSVAQIKDDVKSSLNKVGIAGIENISAEFPVAIATLNSLGLQKFATSGDYFITNKYLTELTTELNTNVKKVGDELVITDIDSASQDLIGLVAKMNAAKKTKGKSSGSSSTIVENNV
jgi:hypothetical protein